MKLFRVQFGVPNWKLKTTKDDIHKLAIDWMDGESAPKAVLDLIACKCTRDCKAPKCDYIISGLNCTDICLCFLKNCKNQAHNLTMIVKWMIRIAKIMMFLMMSDNYLLCLFTCRMCKTLFSFVRYFSLL